MDRLFLLRTLLMSGFLSASMLASFTEKLPAADVDPRRPQAIEAEGVPQIPDDLWQRLRQYQNVRQAAFRGWAPDGNGILIQTRFGNTAQLHRVYQPGGRREQVTFFDEPADGRFIPSAPDGTLLISIASGGNEQYQVLATHHESSQPSLLTDGKSRNVLGPVRPDGLFAIVSSTERNGRDTDLLIVDPNRPGERTTVLQTDGEMWMPEDWSAEGTRILMRKYVSINECYPALLDLSSGKRTLIPIPGDVKAAYGAMRFSSDGQSAWLTCDAAGEFRQLARVDLTSMEYTWVSKEIPWDVEEVAVAPSGASIVTSGMVAFTTNEDGPSAIYLLSGDRTQKLDIPMGQVENLEFSPDGLHLGFTLLRPDRPSDAYSMNLTNGKLTQWSFSEAGGLSLHSFVQPQIVRFKTFDERQIPAFVYRPASASKDHKVPVIINIHGGPESQSRPYFDGLTQFYVSELGMAVIYPNVRGSDGYGKTYLQLDNGPKREDSVKDIGALLDWIAAQPDLDASRVAVYGGSYGGYMVLASLTHYSDRLKCGVDIVGIASFKTFLENTSAYRRDLRRAEYGDERTAEMQAVFQKIDPLNNADRIRTALLVAHGKNDPRVPFSEAEQIAPRVRANGQTVWTLYAGNEGHGFAKKENRDYITAAITLFYLQHLKPE